MSSDTSTNGDMYIASGSKPVESLSSASFGTVETKEDVKKKAAVQSTTDWNSLLIWARKQRGPYYDPSTKLYHVDRYSDLYYHNYTDMDVIAENTAAGHKMPPVKPTPIVHHVEKEFVSHGNHLSPARSGSPSGRRPGRPRKSEAARLLNAS